VMVRTGWGLALLCVPRQVLSLAGHPQPTRAAAVVVRILGGRHLVQVGLVLMRPSRRTIWAGATFAFVSGTRGRSHSEQA
jgi:hypothetical protein